MSNKAQDGQEPFLLSKDNKAEWSDPTFWRQLLPSLTISDDNGDNDRKMPAQEASMEDHAEYERRRQCLVNDGYALVDRKNNDHNNNSTATTTQSTTTTTNVLIDKLRNGILTLHQRHPHSLIPSTFILLYDETWQLAQEANTMLRRSTHSRNIFAYDMLAWCIDPTANEAGFSPHRDRQPENVLSSFHSTLTADATDQSSTPVSSLLEAKYVTLWWALSDATPENSCLYVIPKQHDPGYLHGDETDTDKDPLQRALSTKESFQHIRALPRRTGEAVLFTHRILHWGSKGNPNNTTVGPRVAISFVCTDPDLERPYLRNTAVATSATHDDNHHHDDNEEVLPIPAFRVRLLLVCAQLLIYYQRFDLDKATIKACYEYCKEYGQEYLDPTYRNKVMVEFVKAMKEQRGVGGESHQQKDNGSSSSSGGHDKEVKMGGKEQDTDMKTTKDLTRSTAFGFKTDKDDDDDDDDDDEEEEALLEEMLQAEKGGYGEFQDDFDGIVGGQEGTGLFDQDAEDDDGNDDDDDFEDDENDGGIDALFAQSANKKRKLGS